MKHYYLFFIISLISFSSIAQLELKDIMKGNDFIGTQPHHLQWTPNNSNILFKWKKDSTIFQAQYLYSIKNQKIIGLSLEKQIDLPLNGFLSNGLGDYYFQNAKGIYFVNENANKLIFQTSEKYRLIQVLSPGKILLKHNNTFIVFDHLQGLFKELIRFKPNKTTSEEYDYVSRQELLLFDFLKEEYKENKLRQAGLQNQKKILENTYPIQEQSVQLFTVNHQNNFALFRLDKYPENTYTEMPNYITKNGQVALKKARPKAGAKNVAHTLAFYDFSQKDYGVISTQQLPGILQDPAYLKIYNPDIDLNRDTPKEVVFTQIIFNATGDKALIEIKSQDNKDRWICVFYTQTKNLECINHQKDNAWIGGPGISSWNMVPGNIGWFPEEDKVFFQSELTGYSHVYTYQLENRKTEQLTHGNFEVHQAKLSKKGDVFYIIANKTHPGNRNFYHFHIPNKTWTPILEKNGNYEVSISPNEKLVAYRYSFQNKPWEIFITENKPKNKPQQITHSTTKEFRNYTWRTPEIIKFKNRNNLPVYARIYRPSADKKNGAAIQFVHGAGYLQNAHYWWSAYYREYMFHNLLCDKGYTVLDIDYTASAGYGRNFRTGIYRHMGGNDLTDQIDGRKYLIDQEGIDSSKIGIYGGSYGGFITIMALLKYPHNFQCGAAIRSVTDWAHYNSAYTSNILNTPQTDSLAFQQSSPIYFAKGLQDELLILHGMQDDNVQFQDVVRLNQRFIELGINTFTMALYPIEPHGFVKTSSWVDEYSRILKLFDAHLTNE